MMAITHFAVGMIIGIPISRWQERLTETTVIIISGLWALGPDIAKFVPEPGNVFWFHSLLDAIETGRPLLEALVSLVALLIVVLVSERFK